MNVPMDVERVAARARELMDSGRFGCSEALILAFRREMPERLPVAVVALSSAFRGGMSAGCACGALAASEMVLGSVLGHQGDENLEQDPQRVKEARARYKELHDRFKETFGAACCRVLTKGLEHGSPERKANCVRLVEQTARLTADFLNGISAGQ